MSEWIDCPRLEGEEEAKGTLNPSPLAKGEDEVDNSCRPVSKDWNGYCYKENHRPRMESLMLGHVTKPGLNT